MFYEFGHNRLPIILTESSQRSEMKLTISFKFTNLRSLFTNPHVNIWLLFKVLSQKLINVKM